MGSLDIGRVCPAKPSPPLPLLSQRERRGKEEAYVFVILPSLPLGERGRGSEGFEGQDRSTSKDELNHEGSATAPPHRRNPFLRPPRTLRPRHRPIPRRPRNLRLPLRPRGPPRQPDRRL